MAKFLAERPGKIISMQKRAEARNKTKKEWQQYDENIEGEDKFVGGDGSDPAVPAQRCSAARAVAEADVSLNRFAVVSVLGLALNQRLVRRICDICRGEGCESCLKTGYKGRVPLVEWVKVDEPLRSRLQTNGAAAVTPSESLETAARELVRRGLTDKAEIRRVLGI